MSENHADQGKLKRDAQLRWVPIPQMRVPPMAQRSKLSQARVHYIASNLDLEQIGTPTVNERDGAFYIMDGWHRIEALKEYGFGGDQIQCWTYAGLTEEQEAERFLKLNDTLAVDAYSKFKVGVQAGRPEETEINRIVRAHQLRISQDKGNGAIAAVSTLRKIYRQGGADVLGRTVRIIRDAYGDAGLDAAVLGGVGLLCQRYDSQLDDAIAVERLATAHGGVNGLLNKAENLKRQTGSQKNHCVAAAAVDIINSKRGGKKLPAWWKTDTNAA